MHPGMGGTLLDQRKQLLQLGRLEVERVPQLGDFFIREAAGGDSPYDLRVGLKRRLLLALGVAKALGGKRPLGDLHRPTPVPRGAERGDLLPERDWRKSGRRTFVDVALKVRERETVERVLVAEASAEVIEVHPRRVERVCLDCAV